ALRLPLVLCTLLNSF
ncbi:hypothetical protein D049_1717B, partial [Vibrio parahaemolyticus VPTS-2010]